MNTREVGGMRDNPPEVGILALSPVKGRTPWWSRRMKYSHIVLVMGDYVWDQPIDNIGQAYDLLLWLENADPDGSRDYRFQSVGDIVSRYWWDEGCKLIANRKGQKIRSFLRWLGFPIKAWNCTSPIRILLDFGMNIHLEGETPDEIIKELAAHSRG